MSFAELPVSWLFFASSLVALSLAGCAWKRKQTAVGIYFLLTMVLAALWAFSSGMQLALTDVDQKAFWVDFVFVFAATIPVTWLFLARAFSGSGHAFRRNTILPYFAVPAITLVLIATNWLHHLVFLPGELFETEWYTTIRRDYGFWFWVHIGYSYSLYLAGFVLIVRQVFVTSGVSRRRALVLALGPVIPFVFNMIFLSGQSAFSYLDLTSVFFCLTGGIFFYGLFRFRLLDLMPVAREQVIQVMEDPILILTTDGVVADANPALRPLLPPGKKRCTGSQFVDALPDLAHLWPQIQSTNRISRSVRINRNGEWRWYQFRSMALNVGSTAPGGHLIVLRDITEQKEAELQLQAAKIKAEELSALKSAFLTNMRHDIRTPLAGIIGLADLLKEESPEKLHQEFAEMIREGGERLLRMLNSVLSVAHLSSGNLDQNMDLVDVTDLCARISADFEREAERVQLPFHVLVPAEPVLARLDSDHLGHALTHLLDNAFRYTEKGSVTLELVQQETDLVIFVKDTGRGFDQSFVQGIGQEFDHSFGDGQYEKGTGLGLRVAYGLVEEMGGTITLQSRPGRGSIFTVRMPDCIQFREAPQHASDRIQAHSLPSESHSAPRPVR